MGPPITSPAVAAVDAQSGPAAFAEALVGFDGGRIAVLTTELRFHRLDVRAGRARRIRGGNRPVSPARSSRPPTHRGFSGPGYRKSGGGPMPRFRWSALRMPNRPESSRGGLLSPWGPISDNGSGGRWARRQTRPASPKFAIPFRRNGEAESSCATLLKEALTGPGIGGMIVGPLRDGAGPERERSNLGGAGRPGGRPASLAGCVVPVSRL